MKVSKTWLFLFLPFTVQLLVVLANAWVTHANAGLMPVKMISPLMKLSWNHIAMTADTHLNFLCDWMTSNLGMQSPGDVLQNLSGELKAPSILAWLGFMVVQFKEKLCTR